MQDISMTMFTCTELLEEEEFDPSTLVSGVPFTQAQFYGTWQKNLGRSVRRFVVSEGGKPVAFFKVIAFPLIFGKKYLYIPYGPVLSAYSVALCEFIRAELLRITREEHAVFARLDFSQPLTQSELSPLFTKALEATYHSAYFQPRLEWYLPLTKDVDTLYGEIHEKNRYSIRLAERKGVEVSIVTQNFTSYFDTFMTLMEDTAARNGFSLHAREYYAYVFEHLTECNGYLAVATYEGQTLVIDVVVVYGGVANHIYGASSSEHRTISPSGLTQWKSIQHAKEMGAQFYNFGGISDGDLYQGWEGLTRFKKRFGGVEMHHSPFYDVVLNWFWYTLYNLRKTVQKLKRR